MAKNGSSFPDLSGDGRTTRKDILIGRGVELKRGGKVKKRVKKKKKRAGKMGGGVMKKTMSRGGRAMKRGGGMMKRMKRGGKV